MPIGTLWAVSLDERRFDEEDASLLERSALFAAIIEDVAQNCAAVAASRCDTWDRLAYSLDMICSISRRPADRSAIGGTGMEAASRLSERMLAFTQAKLGATRSAKGADLSSLFADILIRHGERPGERIMLTGPSITVPERSAGIGGLAFREIIDNAYRHGALGKCGGIATTGWHRAADDKVIFVWTEHSAGLVLPMAIERGFGLDFLSAACVKRSKSTFERSFDRKGLSIRLSLPV